MKFSVFTPSNNLQHYTRPFQSLVDQTFKDFEWIILLNGEALKNRDKL